MIIRTVRQAGTQLLGCLATTLAWSSIAHAKVTDIYTFNNYVETPGGIKFDTITASGSFTFGTTLADQTSDAHVFETYGNTIYDYHLTGPYDGPGWGPLPSQLPPIVFPGFPDTPRPPATFHIGLLVPSGHDTADFVDAGQNEGYVTVTHRIVTSSAPEPAAWALMLVGFGTLGVSFRQRRFRSTLQGG